jgi:hypothetical protein
MNKKENKNSAAIKHTDFILKALTAAKVEMNGVNEAFTFAAAYKWLHEFNLDMKKPKEEQIKPMKKKKKAIKKG